MITLAFLGWAVLCGAVAATPVWVLRGMVRDLEAEVEALRTPDVFWASECPEDGVRELSELVEDLCDEAVVVSCAHRLADRSLVVDAIPRYELMPAGWTRDGGRGE